MKTLLKFIIALLTTVFFTKCNHSQLDIDTSKIDMKPVVINRLDKDVFALNASNIGQQTTPLLNKYGAFYNRYVSTLGINGAHDSLYPQKLIAFTSDKDMSEAYADIQKTYSENDVELLSEELTEAVKRFKVFFPSRKIPSKFVAFMGGFNYNIVYVDSTLGVGLEMYLGQQSKFYNMMRLPNYRTVNMNKENILPDMIRGWLITEFDNGATETKLINHLIFYGKLFYACDALLPKVADSLKIGYNTKQLDYCHKFESNLWGFFAKDNKLFENDMKIVSEFTNDGPFSGSISKECPPRIAMWVGWQLVKSYMKNNPKVTVDELMNEKDAQKILSKSKYKP